MSFLKNKENISEENIIKIFERLEKKEKLTKMMHKIVKVLFFAIIFTAVSLFILLIFEMMYAPSKSDIAVNNFNAKDLSIDLETKCDINDLTINCELIEKSKDNIVTSKKLIALQVGTIKKTEKPLKLFLEKSKLDIKNKNILALEYKSFSCSPKFQTVICFLIIMFFLSLILFFVIKLYFPGHDKKIFYYQD